MKNTYQHNYGTNDTENKPYYPNKCKWCGKPFKKTHNRQEYCSKECSHFARLEQKAIYQRKRRKLINNGELISNESQHIGSGFLSEHCHDDFDKEYESIQKEKKRIKRFKKMNQKDIGKFIEKEIIPNNKELSSAH